MLIQVREKQLQVVTEQILIVSHWEMWNRTASLVGEKMLPYNELLGLGRDMTDILHLSTPSFAPLDADCSHSGPDTWRMGSAFSPGSHFLNWVPLSQHKAYFSWCILSKCHPLAGNIITSSCWNLFFLDFWTDFISTVSKDGLSLSRAST